MKATKISVYGDFGERNPVDGGRNHFTFDIVNSMPGITREQCVEWARAELRERYDAELDNIRVTRTIESEEPWEDE